MATMVSKAGRRIDMHLYPRAGALSFSNGVVADDEELPVDAEEIFRFSIWSSWIQVEIDGEAPPVVGAEEVAFCSRYRKPRRCPASIDLMVSPSFDHKETGLYNFGRLLDGLQDARIINRKAADCRSRVSLIDRFRHLPHRSV